MSYPFASPYVSHLPPSIPSLPSGVTFTFVDLLMLQMNFVPPLLVVQASNLYIRDLGLPKGPPYAFSSR